MIDFFNELFANGYFWAGLAIGLLPGIPSIIQLLVIAWESRK